MAGPIRKDEFGALESLKRGPVKRDNDGADLAFQSLSSRGMAEKKGSNWLLTPRGKVTLQRRIGTRRSSR